MIAIKSILLALASCITMGASVQATTTSGPLDYRRPAHWVCRATAGSACGDDLTTTVLLPDGSTRLEAFVPDKAPKADCFYVYPTVSTSKGLTAAPVVTESERRAVREQAERLTSVCRLFAPLYRQVTVTSMMAGFPKPTEAEDRAASSMAEGDIMAAWDDYIAHDNHGRPVILIGHSQGAMMLVALIKRRIDGHAIGDRLVSAVLPGAFVIVPKGKSTGGTFRTIPPCSAANQTRCVIAFNSVRADRLLPPDMKFPFEGMEQVCTNPASLAGGPGMLKPYLSTTGETIIPTLTGRQGNWTSPEVKIRTPFVATPDLYVAECRHNEHGTFLNVSVRRRPKDHRTGSLAGDWLVDGKPDPMMGLHLIDLNLTAGNLIDILRLQINSRSWPAARQPEHRLAP